MIPVKILTSEEAERLGLKKPTKKSGFGIKGVGCVVQGKHGGEGKLMEEIILRENGDLELVFMDPEREKELKSRRQFTGYLKQFTKIPEGLK
ncbi:MAG: hypothetical protein KJ559_03070 [Nanoarchaeota archaeon]|nr:hypothetical protein [Nanoarchaeota archaeon]